MSGFVHMVFAFGVASLQLASSTAEGASRPAPADVVVDAQGRALAWVALGGGRPWICWAPQRGDACFEAVRLPGELAHPDGAWRMELRRHRLALVDPAGRAWSMQRGAAVQREPNPPRNLPPARPLRCAPEGRAPAWNGHTMRFIAAPSCAGLLPCPPPPAPRTRTPWPVQLRLGVDARLAERWSWAADSRSSHVDASVLVVVRAGLEARSRPTPLRQVRVPKLAPVHPGPTAAEERAARTALLCEGGRR